MAVTSSEGQGILRIVATPIGNLGDITIRALDALREADVIYCEDTRTSRKLLSHYQISKKLLPYHMHNEEEAAKSVIAAIKAGSNACLISDAGSPLVSDPGGILVRKLIDEGLAFEALPGPCAAIVAYQLSGLWTQGFYFGGFLPKKSGDIRKALEKAEGLDCTALWYLSVHSAVDTLEIIAQMYPDRRLSLSRELTKTFEETLRGTAAEILNSLGAVKGEIAIALAPMEKKPPELPCASELKKELASLEEEAAPKDALKILAAKYGVSKNSLYGILKT